MRDGRSGTRLPRLRVRKRRCRGRPRPPEGASRRSIGRIVHRLPRLSDREVGRRRRGSCRRPQPQPRASDESASCPAPDGGPACGSAAHPADGDHGQLRPQGRPAWRRLPRRVRVERRGRSSARMPEPRSRTHRRRSTAADPHAAWRNLRLTSSRGHDGGPDPPPLSALHPSRPLTWSILSPKAIPFWSIVNRMRPLSWSLSRILRMLRPRPSSDSTST